MTNGDEWARERFSPQWKKWRKSVPLDDYEKRFDDIAARGENPHGEADFVVRYAPASVLDAGCGFGRIGSELVNRGVFVVGVDLDPDLIERAQRRTPNVEWLLGDLSDFALDRQFSLVLLAGNVLGFAADPGAVTRNCARHVEKGGRLVIGNQLQIGWPTPADIDVWAGEEGLVREACFANWNGDLFAENSDYMVTVHRRD